MHFVYGYIHSLAEYCTILQVLSEALVLLNASSTILNILCEKTSILSISTARQRDVVKSAWEDGLLLMVQVSVVHLQ